MESGKSDMVEAAKSESRTRMKILATVGLMLLAGILSQIRIPFFFGIELVFFSIPAMLAILLLGTLPAVAVALAGSLYTIIAWGHPYGILIFTLEGLVAALLYRRVIHTVMLADFAFWLMVGAPLLFLLYSGIIGMPRETVALIALKSSFNGVLNALIAGIIFNGLRFWRNPARRLGLGRPGLQGILYQIMVTSVLVAGGIPILLNAHHQRDEHEAFLAERMVFLAEDIAQRWKEGGTLADLPSEINARPGSRNMGIALMSQDGTIIARHGEVKSIDAQGPDEGQMVPRKDGLAIWMPSEDLPTMERWKKGRYVAAVPLEAAGEIACVVLEQDAEPFVMTLEKAHLGLFIYLVILTAAAVLGAFLLSRWITGPLINLASASRGVARQIESGTQAEVPGSAVREYAKLAGTLRDMAQGLSESFDAIQAARGNLERQVHERTAELDRFKNTLDLTLDCVFMFDPQTMRVSYANAGALRLVGYSPSDLFELRAHDLETAVSEAAYADRAASLLSRRLSTITYETNIASRWGEPRPVEVFLQYVEPDGGPPRFVAIMREIGERKRAEEKLRATTQLLDSVVENIPNMIFLKRASDLRFELFNRAGERLLGRSRAELLGRNDYDFFPKEQADFFTGKDREVLERTDVTDIPEEDIETLSGLRILHTQKLALRDADGQPQYLLGISEDITERKRVERVQNEFISIVSHELRTPLTAISGALGLLSGGIHQSNPAQAAPLIAIAHKNAQRLNFLVNDLIDMERLVAGKMHFDNKVQDLMPLIDLAVRENQAFADQFQVRLEIARRADGLQVNADAHRIQQVMANLLSNAAKFSPLGGVVTVTVRDQGGQARIDVADLGPGVPAAFRDRIFQKFAQADSTDTRQKGGTGLGLAITKELVERMGGRVGFDSIEGQGATFFVELPSVSGVF